MQSDNHFDKNQFDENQLQSKKEKKTLQELTMKDNFMFAAVMFDSENCKEVLECILGIEIAHVEVCYEKSVVYNPEYKGVRLDVYAKDDNQTCYNVEMQVVKQKLFKRARYYHGQIDMDLLASGVDYEELPDSYVIFICDFDPVGSKKYRYTKKEVFAEDVSCEYEDGSHTIFLSTKGKNDDEVPEQLAKFLRYVGATKEESEKEFHDPLVEKLQASVKKIKKSREMRNRYMLFELMMRDEFRAGKEEGIQLGKEEGIRLGKDAFVEAVISLLSSRALISDYIIDSLHSITDMDKLTALNIKAATVESVEEFEEEVHRMISED